MGGVLAVVGRRRVPKKRPPKINLPRYMINIRAIQYPGGGVNYERIGNVSFRIDPRHIGFVALVRKVAASLGCDLSNEVLQQAEEVEAEINKRVGELDPEIRKLYKLSALLGDKRLRAKVTEQRDKH